MPFWTQFFNADQTNQDIFNSFSAKINSFTSFNNDKRIELYNLLIEFREKLVEFKCNNNVDIENFFTALFLIDENLAILHRITKEP